MSHFAVLVITPEQPTERVLEEVMMPFHEYECTGIERYLVETDVTDDMLADFEAHKAEGDVFGPEWVKGWSGAIHRDGRYFQRTNPNAKWDWYVLGGRWQGMLLTKPGVKTLTGEPGVFDNPSMNDGGVDACRVADLDLEGMQAAAMKAAGEEYDTFHRVLAGRTIESFEAIASRFSKDDVETARSLYWSQPAVSDLREQNLMPIFDGVEKYNVTREQFLEKARKNALILFAVVKDGTWYEKGGMGWFGMVMDEKDPDQWTNEFNKLIEGLPADHWLSVVDCHI